MTTSCPVTTVPPTIFCPADIMVNNAPGQNGANVTVGGASATGTPTPTISYAPPSGFFLIGTTPVTATATNSAGSAQCTFSVIVDDVEDPVLAGVPGDQTIYTGPGATSCSAPATWTAPTASDNSGGASLSASHSPGSSFPVGTTTVTYTATDPSGNATSASFEVTVIDNTPPTISGLPGAITQGTGPGNPNPSVAVSWTAPTASDNCPVSLSSSHNPGDTFPIGTTTVTYTATDAVGNETNASFDVTVVDDTPPVIAAPTNASFQCFSEVPPANPGSATASDNSGSVDVDVSETDNGGAGSTASPLVITRTFTATDPSGNTASDEQTITVIDNTAPTISGLPGAITQGTGPGNPNPSVAVSWTAPSASDNCSLASFTSSHNPGDTFDIGTTTVTYTATDAVGNETSASFDVTVFDNTPPVISGLAGVLNFLVCEAVDLGIPTVTDNYQLADDYISNNASSPFSLGPTTVVWTATDAAGNTSTFAQTVNVTYGDVDGFLSPMAYAPTAIKIKKGRTVPVKFRLLGCPGFSTAVVNIAVDQGSSSVEAIDPIEPIGTSSADVGTLFRYTDDHYHFNLGTSNMMVGKIYRVRAFLANGPVITGYLNVTK